MTSNVETTLRSALPAGAEQAYPVPFRDVVNALVEREYNLTESIANEVAARTSYSKEQALGQLVALGMAVRPAPEPEPVAVPDMAAFEDALTEAPAKKKGKKGKKSEVAKLAKVVNKLVKAAQRHGVSI